MVEVDVLPVEADDEDVQGAEAGTCIGAIMAHALSDDEEEVKGAHHGRPHPPGRATAEKQQRGPHPQISKLLASPRRYTELREYVKYQDFWRVPHFFRDMEADLEDEEEYIESLHMPEEDEPKRRVRLLAQSEREFLIQGLRQQFQKATAAYLTAAAAAPNSRPKEHLEDLERIKQDIANLSHPYVFVEA
ncbi:unnamed protein product [Durusdinium trenchii]|uniref:Enkurin domain-containing protein n=1 Tax=Durusdinium trenchii TaxID=1381693 RepID=A0ABP0J7Z4_9DINO